MYVGFPLAELYDTLASRQMDAGVRAAEKAEIKAEGRAKLCMVFQNAW